MSAQPSSSGTAPVEVYDWETEMKIADNLNNATNMKNSLMLYGAMTLLDDDKRSPSSPFLRRNLWFMKKNNLETTEYVKTVRNKPVDRSFRMKKLNLKLLVVAIKMKNVVDEDIKKKHKIAPTLTVAQKAVYLHLKTMKMDPLPFLRSPMSFKNTAELLAATVYERAHVAAVLQNPIIFSIHKMLMNRSIANYGVGFDTYQVVQHSSNSKGTGEYFEYSCTPIKLDFKGQLQTSTKSDEKKEIICSCDLKDAISIDPSEENPKKVFLLFVIKISDYDKRHLVLKNEPGFYRDGDLYTIINIWQSEDHHGGFHFTKIAEQPVYEMPRPKRRKNNLHLFDFEALLDMEHSDDAVMKMRFSIRPQSLPPAHRDMSDLFEKYTFLPFSGHYEEPIACLNYKHEKNDSTTAKTEKRRNSTEEKTPVRYCVHFPLEDNDDKKLLEKHVDSMVEVVPLKPETLQTIFFRKKSLECFICRHKFISLKQLLIHMNLNYPRLTFIERDGDWRRPTVDVRVNLNFADLNENPKSRYCHPDFNEPIIFFVGNTAREYRARVMISPKILLKPPNHTDIQTSILLTYFNEAPLKNVDDESDDDSQETTGNDKVEPNSNEDGEKTEREPIEDLDAYHHPIPYPCAVIKSEMALKRMFTYSDVSYESKVFMTSFNSLLFKIGPHRTAKLGEYSLLKLYIHTHRDLLLAYPDVRGPLWRSMINLDQQYSLSDATFMYQDLDALLKNPNYDRRSAEGRYAYFAPPIRYVHHVMTNLHAEYKRCKENGGGRNHELMKRGPSWERDIILQDLEELPKSGLIPASHTLFMLLQEPEDILKKFGYNRIPQVLFEHQEFPKKEHYIMKKPIMNFR